MRFCWAATLAVAAAEYSEHERVDVYDYTTYYRDETSQFRVPGWMREAKYADMINEDGLQVDGAWNMKNGIVDLGNGVTAGTAMSAGSRVVQGSSSQIQSDFIASVRAFHESRGGEVNQGIARNPNPNDGNQKVWDHIRNFWYRDGDLFALIADDNACDMMREGEGQHDVSLDFVDETTTLRFTIEKEQHHLEHLRDFCVRMGGTLYAPSSQEEYDDLFEREHGVCAKHMPVWENGAPYGNPGEERNHRIEVYLNLHRNGYLQCPDDDYFGTKRSKGDEDANIERKPWNVDGNRDGCPTDYNANESMRDTNRESYKTYFSTDNSFAANSEDTCPLSLAEGPYLYSVFETAANVQRGPADPYMPASWWTEFSINNMRFQKFVQNDAAVLNAPLAVSDGNKQRQKDCVAVKCDAGYETGPADDIRYETEWNAEYCNQQRHVGICRVPVVGCNKPTYRCADGYTNSCGNRAVYVEDFTAWLDNDVAARVVDMIMESSFDDEGKYKLMNPSKIRVGNSRSDIVTRNVVCTNDEDASDVEAFMSERVDDFGIVVEYIECNAERTMRPGDGCTCKCSFDTYEKFVAKYRLGENLISDLNDNSYGFVSEMATCAENKQELECNHSWSCNAPNMNDCYTGATAAECRMDDSGVYAKWAWSGKKAPKKLCTRHCCDTYDDSIHTKASLSSAYQIDYKAGDDYTVTCTKGNHILGEADDVISLSFTIEKEDLFDSCYRDVECGPLACKTCPVLENGYCHNKKNPFQDLWQTGETVRCRCNRCFGMRGAPHSLPWDEAECVAPGWEIQGKCVPVQCGNAPNLMFEGRLAGIPVDQKAGCGETIAYDCAPGFVFEDGVQPTATCDDRLPTADEGDYGTQGFYGDIVGRCVPDTGCKMPPASEDKAWDPVFFANRDFGSSCHAEETYNLANELNAGNVDIYPEGTYAVYECYDDFNAIKKFGFRQFMKNANLEIDCAAGTKAPNANCRNNQTGDRFTAGEALNTNNDKLVARCVNGEWQVPSHRCVCEEDKHHHKHASVFDGMCEARQAHSHEFSPSQAPPITQVSGCPKMVYTVLGFIPAVFLH